MFPLAVHFAEAVGARIYGLPHKQFLIEKAADSGHAFTDLTGRYGDPGLKRQLAQREARRSWSGSGAGADAAT